MTTISMIEAKRMIISHYNANEPLFLVGRPGMGKTALFEDVCYNALKIGYVDFRFPQRDTADIAGMRVPDPKTGRMIHYVPDDLPVDPKRFEEKGIFVCEEINAVSPMLQAVGYGMINERRVGSHKILPGWVPMAAGNHHTQTAGAQRITAALANRFCIKYVEPDVDSWCKQYGSEHSDARGLAFLRFRPELFSVLPGETVTSQHGNQTLTLPKDTLEHPSARSWTKAFKFIDSPDRFQHFSGYVSEIVAREFEAFWRILSTAVSLDEIIAHPLAAPLPPEDQPGTYYAVCGMISRFMDRKNVAQLGKYVERLQGEYQVAIYQDATRRDASLLKTGAYTKFAADNAELLS